VGLVVLLVDEKVEKLSAPILAMTAVDDSGGETHVALTEVRAPVARPLSMIVGCPWRRCEWVGRPLEAEKLRLLLLIT
jgi:hypothetical protein